MTRKRTGGTLVWVWIINTWILAIEWTLPVPTIKTLYSFLTALTEAILVRCVPGRPKEEDNTPLLSHALCATESPSMTAIPPAYSQYQSIDTYRRFLKALYPIERHHLTRLHREILNVAKIDPDHPENDEYFRPNIPQYIYWVEDLECALDLLLAVNVAYRGFTRFDVSDMRAIPHGCLENTTRIFVNGYSMRKYSDVLWRHMLWPLAGKPSSNVAGSNYGLYSIESNSMPYLGGIILSPNSLRLEGYARGSDGDKSPAFLDVRYDEYGYCDTVELYILVCETWGVLGQKFDFRTRGFERPNHVWIFDRPSRYTGARYISPTVHVVPEESFEGIRLPQSLQTTRAQPSTLRSQDEPKSSWVLENNLIGASLGSAFRILGFLRSENHGYVYALDDAVTNSKEYEAKAYTLRGIPKKVYEYRVRNLKKIAAKHSFVCSIDEHGYKFIVSRVEEGWPAASTASHNTTRTLIDSQLRNMELKTSSEVLRPLPSSQTPVSRHRPYDCHTRSCC